MKACTLHAGLLRTGLPLAVLLAILIHRLDQNIASEQPVRCLTSRIYSTNVFMSLHSAPRLRQDDPIDQQHFHPSRFLLARLSQKQLVVTQVVTNQSISALNRKSTLQLIVKSQTYTSGNARPNDTPKR